MLDPTAPRRSVELVISDCDGVLGDHQRRGLAHDRKEARIAFQDESSANIAAAVERQIGQRLPAPARQAAGSRIAQTKRVSQISDVRGPDDA